jgi:ribosomal protein S27E
MININMDREVDAKAKSMLTPGSWYLGLKCDACEKLIAVFDDPTDTGDIAASGSGALRVQCTFCGETRSYPATKMLPFQAAVGVLIGGEA